LTAIQETVTELGDLGVKVAAVSVDSPEMLARFRRECGLEFDLLSDESRETVRAWGLFNARERGGIARPAVFVLDTDGRIVYRSLDGNATRVETAALLAFLRACRRGEARLTDNSSRSFVVPGIWDALASVLRYVGPR
jgi:peroxiredoxin